ncbi:MAG: hypothetical protein AAGE52_28150 [Myxococcota bacterium]
MRERRLELLELEVRTEMECSKAGFETIGDVVEHSSSALKDKGLSDESIQELVEVAQSLGLNITA